MPRCEILQCRLRNLEPLCRISCGRSTRAILFNCKTFAIFASPRNARKVHHTIESCAKGEIEREEQEKRVEGEKDAFCCGLVRECVWEGGV